VGLQQQAQTLRQTLHQTRAVVSFPRTLMGDDALAFWTQSVDEAGGEPRGPPCGRLWILGDRIKACMLVCAWARQWGEASRMGCRQ